MESLDKRPMNLSCKALHSMRLSEGRCAAWTIQEGPEDPGFIPIAYSKADLSQWSTHGLYNRMNTEYMSALLDEVNRLAR
jgi:hypothetical protein